MGMKGCLSVTKYFLFVFNLFFFILGGVLLCFGLWILFDRSSFAAMIGSSTPTLKIWSYVLSGVGILTMLLGFLGCLGSLKEIKCLLGFYFAFLLLLFAAQITVGVLVYTQRSSLNSAVGKYVEDIIRNYGSFTNQTELQEGLDFAQEQMSCCGWFAPEDWRRNQKISENSSLNLYPCSCRNVSSFLSNPNINGTGNDTDTSEPLPEQRSGFCTTTSRDNWPVYKTGCMNSIQTFILNNFICIIGVCIGIALLEFLQFMGHILALVLEKRLMRSSSDDILFFPVRETILGVSSMCLFAVMVFYYFLPDNNAVNNGANIRRCLCPCSTETFIRSTGKLFVMTLSMCLCRNLDQNYNKLARYS